MRKAKTPRTNLDSCDSGAPTPAIPSRTNTLTTKPAGRGPRAAGMDSVPDNLAAQLLADTEFVSNLARYSEKLLTEQFIRRKYNLTDDAWEHLGNDNALIEA